MMLWHILKRELFDHINSLRFALTTFIMIALMVTNAIVHLQKYADQIQEYSKNVTVSINKLKAQTRLYTLVQRGPGELYKRPSALSFIANGGDAFLPKLVIDDDSWTASDVKSIATVGYPETKQKSKNLRPPGVPLDWVFIITYLFSFIPILFSFDALSGEREHGTLRLCLANPISRSLIVVSKFLGILIALVLPFTFAFLLNIAILSTSPWIQFAPADWARLALVFLIVCCYACIFIAVGLMVSARLERRMSLVVLLLIWVIVVVFMPLTLGTLAVKWSTPIQTVHQFRATKREFINNTRTENSRKWSQMKQHINQNIAQKDELLSLLRFKMEWVNFDRNIREALNREYLMAQIKQVQQARFVCRLSPAATVQYTLESMAATGLNRHRQFVENVQLYTKRFRQFIVEIDSTDAESLHLIGIPEGMSNKPITAEQIPIFEDKLTFRDSFNSALVDMSLLVLFAGVFLSGACLFFLRADV